MWLASLVRDNDGRKLDHATLEQLRLRTVEQIASGHTTCAQAARALGLAESTVYAWWRTYRQAGTTAALRAKPVPGAKRKLTDQQLAEVYGLIADHEPRDHGLSAALWTRDLVRQAVKMWFGVELTLASIGRTLHDLGLSAQRPSHRPVEADAAKIAAWRTETWPALHAEAKAAGATIFFLDEAGVRSDHRTGTTWAPVGVTPQVKATGKRSSINMISVVPLKGTLRFSVFTGRFTAAVFIAFLARLLRDVPGPIVIVTDNHPVHHARAVKAWIEKVNTASPGRLRLVFLPPYAPQLNPVEWVWKNVKHDKVGRAHVRDAAQLRAIATGALRSLQKLPKTVAGFFGDPELAYIAG
jgi:transposase